MGNKFFKVDLSRILKFVDINNVAQLVEEANDDKEEPEVILEGDELQFTVDFAIKKFLSQLITKMVSTTRALKNKALERGGSISLALMLGGFSACQPLVTQIQQ